MLTRQEIIWCLLVVLLLALLSWLTPLFDAVRAYATLTAMVALLVVVRWLGGWRR